MLSGADGADELLAAGADIEEREPRVMCWRATRTGEGLTATARRVRGGPAMRLLLCAGADIVADAVTDLPIPSARRAGRPYSLPDMS